MNKLNLKVTNLKQRGAIVLLTVVLLLIMITLVTLYTGKIQSFEHRIITNSQSYKWAKASAKAGLEKSLAMIKATKTLPNSVVVEIMDDDNHFSVDNNQQTHPNLRANSTLFTLISTGKSADGLATSKVSEQFLLYPLLHNIPVAPFMVKGGFKPVGQFEIVTNPNGLGSNLPLSVWSDMSVILSAAARSCYVKNFSSSQCQLQFLSEQGAKSSDILDSSATFPMDLFSYLFNIPLANWSNLKQLAKFQLLDCQSLDQNSIGLIWVTGTCNIGLAKKIAKKSQPLILIVTDGNLKLDKAAIIYGLVLSFKPPNSTLDTYIDMNAGAFIEGALASNHSLGDNNETTRVVYNAGLLQMLQSQTELLDVARVPGSWRDF